MTDVMWAQSHIISHNYIGRPMAHDPSLHVITLNGVTKCNMTWVWSTCQKWLSPTTKALFLHQLSPFISLPHSHSSLSPFPIFPLPSPSLPSLHSSPTAKRPPWSQLEGLRERCKLPQWCLGQSPSRHRFCCILRGKIHLTAIIIWIFVYWNLLNF